MLAFASCPLTNENVHTVYDMSLDLRKRTFEHVRTAKIQISLLIRAVRSENLLDASWHHKNNLYNADPLKPTFI